MARKPKSDIEAAVEENEGRKAYGGISVDNLNIGLSRIDEIAAEMSKLQGDQSAALNRVEKLGGHKAVLKLVKRIRDMDQTHGQDFVRAFFSYMLELGVFEQLELLNDDTEDALRAVVLGPLFQTGAAQPEMAAEPTVQ